MATALTAYLSQTAAATIGVADRLWVNTTGGTAGSKNTTIGTLTGYGELVSQGAGTFQGAGSIGAPTGKGWILELSELSLEGQQMLAGTWTPTTRHSISAGTLTCDIYVRAHVRSSGGTYTQIGSSMVLAAQSIGTSAATYAQAGTSLPLTNFNTGDKLYIDCWLNVTATTSSAGSTVRVFATTSATLGTITSQVVTPGWQVQPATTGPRILYQRHRIGRIA